MRTTLAIAAAFLASACIHLKQAPPGPGADPPGMACEQVTLVRVHPGPEWEKYQETAPAHLAWLTALMSAGHVTYAGPMSDGDGNLYVYRSPDLRAVAASAAGDPLVANRVATYSVKLWRMCRPMTPAR